MKTSTTKPLTVLGALALAMAHWAPTASTQEHLALGQISSTGNVTNSYNSVGGVLTSTRDSTGNYTVTISASGAFAGTASNDYIVEATCRSAASSDRVAKAHVTSVTPDVIDLRVLIDDVEDDGTFNAPVPANNVFYFSVYRVTGTFADKGSTPYLLSTGRVADDGTLLSGLQLDGLTVSSNQLGTGNYEVTFSNPGAFVGMDDDDFVPILSLPVTTGNDDAVRGSIISVDNDTVTLWVRTDDVQDFNNSTSAAAYPFDYPFQFSLYRVPAGSESGPAKSQVMVALGAVSSAGNLHSGGTFGGSLSTVNNGAGNYTLTITKPGAFAGRSGEEFVAHALVRSAVSNDRTIGASTEVANADTLLIHVRTADAEVSGETEGVLTNRPFYFTVYDAVAAHRPDLQIGNKASLTKHKGDGLYNNTGAGQKIRVKLRDKKNGNPRKKKYFFLAENDGNVVDNLSLRANKSGRQIRAKYFRIDGGRQNVTAALTTGILTLDDLYPGEKARFRAVAKFKKNARKKRKKITHRTHSLSDSAKQDATKAILIRKIRK